MRSTKAIAASRVVGQGRLRNRYPLSAEVAYRLMSGSERPDEGQGRCVNMSSSGVLMETGSELPVGAAIELQISWPAKLGEFVALNLHVRGCTVRSGANGTAVAITRHEFRTRRQIQVDAEPGAVMIGAD